MIKNKTQTSKSIYDTVFKRYGQQTLKIVREYDGPRPKVLNLLLSHNKILAGFLEPSKHKKTLERGLV